MFVLACFCPIVINAQLNPEEAEIRMLKQKEVVAVLEKDSAALLELWSADFVVNGANNMVAFAGETTLDRPVLKQPRNAFTRKVEHVIIKENFAFSMGSETVTPVNNGHQKATVVERRYTNIWQKQQSGWKLVARHANVICNTI